VIGLLGVLLLAACGDDAESSAQLAAGSTSTTEAPTTVAPTTTAASAGTVTTRLTPTTVRPPPTTAAGPLAGIGAGATDITTKPGDFDGNGVADTLRAYKLGGNWHLRVELAGGGGYDLAVTGIDQVNGMRAIGGFNLNDNIADEAFATVGSGASSTFLGIFVFTNCQLVRVTQSGNVLTFEVGASAQRRSGLGCVSGTALQTLSASAPPTTGTPFTGTRTTYDLVGSNLIEANLSPQETYGVNDPLLAPFGRFSCGSLSLS